MGPRATRKQVMVDEALSERVTFGPVRRLLAAAALVVFVVAVGPPLSGEATRYLSAETAQYALLAIVVPALVVLAAPWRLLGLGNRIEARQANKRPSLWQVALVGVPSLAVLIAWRTAPLVDALARHHYLLALEALSLVPAGTMIWLELVSSPPSTPRLSPLGRIPVAAVTMWALWIMAYLVGFAASGAYPAYTHLTGRALSNGADDQLAAGVLWFFAALSFIPVLFASLMSFLRADERRGGSAKPARS